MHASGNNPADSLNEEHKAAHSLLELLKQEQQHLINADIDGLTKLTEEKAKVITQMSELAKSRHRALAMAGFPAEEAGMQEWLNSGAAMATASESWTELLALAQSAKELNRVNGLLIGKHMARNQQALNVLQINVQGANFYGQNGRSMVSATATRGLVVG